MESSIMIMTLFGASIAISIFVDRMTADLRVAWWQSLLVYMGMMTLLVAMAVWILTGS